MISGTAMAAEYKVGIIQFVDDASLNQIEQNIEKELTAKSEEGGDTYVIRWICVQWTGRFHDTEPDRDTAA